MFASLAAPQPASGCSGTYAYAKAPQLGFKASPQSEKPPKGGLYTLYVRAPLREACRRFTNNYTQDVPRRSTMLVAFVG